MEIGKVPLFSDGDPENWISRIEEILCGSELSEDQYIEFALQFLVGQAKSWVSSNADRISKMNWCAFVYNLLWEFDPTRFPDEDTESTVVVRNEESTESTNIIAKQSEGTLIESYDPVCLPHKMFDEILHHSYENVAGEKEFWVQNVVQDRIQYGGKQGEWNVGRKSLRCGYLGTAQKLVDQMSQRDVFISSSAIYRGVEQLYLQFNCDQQWKTPTPLIYCPVSGIIIQEWQTSAVKKEDKGAWLSFDPGISSRSVGIHIIGDSGTLNVFVFDALKYRIENGSDHTRGCTTNIGLISAMLQFGLPINGNVLKHFRGSKEIMGWWCCSRGRMISVHDVHCGDFRICGMSGLPFVYLLTEYFIQARMVVHSQQGMRLPFDTGKQRFSFSSLLETRKGLGWKLGDTSTAFQGNTVNLCRRVRILKYLVGNICQSWFMYNSFRSASLVRAVLFGNLIDAARRHLIPQVPLDWGVSQAVLMVFLATHLQKFKLLFLLQRAYQGMFLIAMDMLRSASGLIEHRLWISTMAYHIDTKHGHINVWWSKCAAICIIVEATSVFHGVSIERSHHFQCILMNLGWSNWNYEMAFAVTMHIFTNTDTSFVCQNLDVKLQWYASAALDILSNDEISHLKVTSQLLKNIFSIALYAIIGDFTCRLASNLVAFFNGAALLANIFEGVVVRTCRNGGDQNQKVGSTSNSVGVLDRRPCLHFWTPYITAPKVFNLLLAIESGAGYALSPDDASPLAYCLFNAQGFLLQVMRGVFSGGTVNKLEAINIWNFRKVFSACLYQIKVLVYVTDRQKVTTNSNASMLESLQSYKFSQTTKGTCEVQVEAFCENDDSNADNNMQLVPRFFLLRYELLAEDKILNYIHCHVNKFVKAEEVRILHHEAFQEVMGSQAACYCLLATYIMLMLYFGRRIWLYVVALRLGEALWTTGTGSREEFATYMTFQWQCYYHDRTHTRPKVRPMTIYDVLVGTSKPSSMSDEYTGKIVRNRVWVIAEAVSPRTGYGLLLKLSLQGHQVILMLIAALGIWIFDPGIPKCTQLCDAHVGKLRLGHLDPYFCRQVYIVSEQSRFCSFLEGVPFATAGIEHCLSATVYKSFSYLCSDPGGVRACPVLVRLQQLMETILRIPCSEVVTEPAGFTELSTVVVFYGSLHGQHLGLLGSYLHP